MSELVSINFSNKQIDYIKWALKNSIWFLKKNIKKYNFFKKESVKNTQYYIDRAKIIYEIFNVKNINDFNFSIENLENIKFYIDTYINIIIEEMDILFAYENKASKHFFRLSDEIINELDIVSINLVITIENYILNNKI